MGAPFIRFYAAARLVVHGETVGTVCVYDNKPHVLTPAQLNDLRTMASAAVELLSRRLAVNGPAGPEKRTARQTTAGRAGYSNSNANLSTRASS
jgi:GAF domain-containing protein